MSRKLKMIFAPLRRRPASPDRISICVSLPPVAHWYTRSRAMFAAFYVLAEPRRIPVFPLPARDDILCSAAMPQGKASALTGILHQLCPRCRSGRIFRAPIYRGFPSMYERCPVCDLKFQREAGYFLGAMYISYGVALVFILLMGAILWVATNWRIDKITIWAILLFLPLALPITLFARVLWIYLDQSVDPEK